MIGFAGQPLQQAKRMWLAINLVLLITTLWILSRVTRFRWEQLLLLALCGFRSLAPNFVYGQYYVFLLFLMTVTFYWLDRNRPAAGGLLAGVTFGLKLYTGPLILFFIARRKWRSVGGMAAASLGMVILAVALFGLADVRYYLTHVLPRTLEGGSVDPYNPGDATLSTLLRRMLLREPELNPNPVLNAPWLFFFSRTIAQLGLVTFTVLGVAFNRSSTVSYDFSWFIILLVLVSTSTASYTFIILLLPITLLLNGASVWKGALLLSCYILLNWNLRPAWMFPKVWLLLLLFVAVGKEQLRLIPRRWVISAGLMIVFASLGDAKRHMLNYAEEPGRRYQQIGFESGAMFSSYPAVSKVGLFYQSIGDYRRGEDRYVLCWLHDGRIDRLSFEGHALHPIALTADGPIWFELVRNRTSTMMRFDPLTRTAVAAPLPASAASESRVMSPDSRWIAFTRETADSEQLWLKNIATGETERLAGGSCNNSSPTWELDSSAVIFASDCGRAFGLSALYRAPIQLGQAKRSIKQSE